MYSFKPKKAGKIVSRNDEVAWERDSWVWAKRILEVAEEHEKNEMKLKILVGDPLSLLSPSSYILATNVWPLQSK